MTDDEKRNGISAKTKRFIPFEMGMPSNIQDGVLPQYYQEPTKIVIDWSREAVRGMRKEKHSDLANEEFRFLKYKNHISFSFTGQYAPTFRIASAPIFLNAASRIIINDEKTRNFLLGCLNSNLIRYIVKNFINHTVNFEVDDVKQIIIPPHKTNERMISLVLSIISKQKQNPRYDYMSNEQVEIDRLVYKMYNLSEEDIQEVENWFYRRYPKLARVIEEKLAIKGG